MNEVIIASLISALSVATVSIISSIIQFRTTKLRLTEELKKLKTEYNLQLDKIRFDEKTNTVKKWKDDFFNMLIDLILETDKEVTKNADMKKIATLVQKLQFLLRPSIPEEEALMRSLTGIALYFSNIGFRSDESEYFMLHASLSDLGRKVYYQDCII